MASVGYPLSKMATGKIIYMDIKVAKAHNNWQSVILIIMLIQLSGLTHAQTNTKKSTRQRRIDIFPAISYSPETKLTLGALGYWYPNFVNQDTENVQSYINFLTLYTTANQILLESNWDVRMDGNKIRFRGGLEFARSLTETMALATKLISG